jgi:hypothetical protein
MALEVVFRQDIGNALGAVRQARYGNVVPGDSDPFLQALDAVGMAFGLERVCLKGEVKWLSETTRKEIQSGNQTW